MATKKKDVEQIQLDLDYSNDKANETYETKTAETIKAKKPSKKDYIEIGKQELEQYEKSKQLEKSIEANEKPKKSRTVKKEIEPVKEVDKVVEQNPKDILATKNTTIDDEIIIPKLEPVEPVNEVIVNNNQTNKIIRFEGITTTNGLNDEQVKKRISEGNVNITKDDNEKSILKIVTSNLFTFFNMLYLVITVLLCAAQCFTNLTYLAVVIPNTVIGIIQEIKARKMIKKLSLVNASKASVVRNGTVKEIDTNEVVIDDVVIFKNGNQIYTDSIVMDGNIEVNESTITGESDAITKHQGDFLYSGSYVVSGTAFAKVENVGKNNYIEKLANEAKKQKGRKSELLRTLNWIIRTIGFLIIPLFIIQFIQAYTGAHQAAPDAEMYELFKTSISSVAGSIIGLIPSGLFLLTSIALYTAIWRLGKKNNTMVNESYSIEMLARVDTLCLDKTGTITDGTMRVIDCVEVENKTDYSIREIVGSMMSVFEDTNATSEALIRFFGKNNVLKPEAILPFSSKRKYSAVTFSNVGSFYLGAPEFILSDGLKKLNNDIRKYASQGCRILALGYLNGNIKKEGTLVNAKPIALIVIQDHIRDDAYQTIEYFRNNGVDIKVISGDNPITVSHIAKRVGIEKANRYISLEGLSDEDVKEIALDYTVFGRVTPSQKKALVEAFKADKRTVAMTGDGVNDILAMKESDCSIAMASGCEATRNIANLVLMDSNFSSMPAVVAEGRRVINNIQRTSTLFLVKTLFTFFLTIFYLLLGNAHPYPFEPSQLTLIEVVIIGIPAAIISLQPNKEKVEGHFIMNVIKSSLPGALTVLFFHVLISLIVMKDIGFVNTYFPSIKDITADYDIYRSIVLVITIVVTWVVLLRMCKPFNWYKRILFYTVTIITFICLVASNKLSIHLFSKEINIGRDFLKITVLTEKQLYFTLICLLLIPFAFSVVEKLISKISKIKL